MRDVEDAVPYKKIMRDVGDAVPYKKIMRDVEDAVPLQKIMRDVEDAVPCKCRNKNQKEFRISAKFLFYLCLMLKA